MSNSPDMKAFEQLSDLIKNFKDLDGRSIQETTYPIESVISKTPKEAVERASYETFLRTNKTIEKDLEKHAQHFVEDMIRKHLG